MAPALARCGDSGPTQARCDDWSDEASTGRRQLQDGAERACQGDEDCVLVDYGMRCFADCGYPSAVARAGLPALEAELWSLRQRTCERFESEQCASPIALPCAPPDSTPFARCDGGACTLGWTALR